jgi:cytochrome c oxidase subunit 2
MSYLIVSKFKMLVQAFIFFVILIQFNGFYLMDASIPGQFGFQDPATPIAEGIIDLHHTITFYLIIVFVLVSWMISYLFINFVKRVSSPSSKSDIEFRSEIFKINKVAHGTNLEIFWTVTPSLILVCIAIPSFTLLYSMDEIIDPTITIKAIGHQWYWSYEYSDYQDFDIAFDSYMVPEDELTTGQLRLLEVDRRVWLPTNTHVRVIITATDVLHSWAIPSLGVKLDAVPGRLNQTSLFIKRAGTYYGQCSEICGVNHGFMPIVVKAVDVSTFNYWINFMLESE